MGDHLSRTTVACRLEQPTRESSGSDRTIPSVWPCSGWGLPSQSSHPDCWCALTAPFHPYLSCPRRFTFCCTFPDLSTGRRYRPPCPAEPGLSSRQPKSTDGHPIQLAPYLQRVSSPDWVQSMGHSQKVDGVWSAFAPRKYVTESTLSRSERRP
jgi:hypothetical protein